MDIRIFEEFRIIIAKQTLSRELRAIAIANSRLGLATMPPCHHAQAEGAIEDF